MSRTAIMVAVLAWAALAAGCAVTPKAALTLTPKSLQERQMQTRYFDTTDAKMILSASLEYLQDLGYSLDNCESNLGLIVVSKDRDATNGGQVALAVLIAAGGGAPPPIDSNQKIRCSVVTFPTGEHHDKTAVRVTFQRIVWNTAGQTTHLEMMKDEWMYKAFFEGLSKSIFLEAHHI